MFSYWMNLMLLAAESQQVIALRMAKLAVGGAPAHEEAGRMIVEKIAAAQGAALSMMFGATPHSVVSDYRGKVRANAHRLRR
jgi:uncharacterized Rossmann fold enzyme